MDASSQNPHSYYIAIGVCFVIVCAIVGCIIYYITKDNTKTEKFSPKITEQITTSPKITGQITTPSLNSCQSMINGLIRDMYTRIMGTPSPVQNYECTPESDRDSFLDTLYYILQVPTLQILNNATSIDNLDKTNFINLWLTAMTGLNDGSMSFIPILAPNLRDISGVKIIRMMPNEDVFVSASNLANRLFSGNNSYPEIPSYPIPDNYKQSLKDISDKAMKLVTLQDITDLKSDDSSIISADNMIKYLLFGLVRAGTFFTK
jgi:hypothetical protein